MTLKPLTADELPDVVLGIDQARCSGWSIALRGKIVAHGVVKQHADPRLTNADRIGVVQRAIRYAGGDVRRLLVVFEDHSDISLSAKGREQARARGQKVKRNTSTILGMGAARARWDDRLDDACHPERLRLQVTSEDWRLRVLGMVNYRGSDALKAEAVRWASAQAGTPVTDHNEAEAMCLCAWGTIDGLSVLQGHVVQRRVRQRAAKQRRRQLTIEDRLRRPA